MSSGPLISILLPVYNAEVFIAESIASILNQTYMNFELIILNDGSTDDSENVIKGVLDSRIKYFHSVSNRGLIFQLNKGIREANGKYIARMDADDIALPDRIEKQVEFLENNIDVGVLGGQLSFIGNKTGKSEYPLIHEDCSKMLLWQSCFAHPTIMIRKSVLVDNDLNYHSEYHAAEDYKLWVDLMDKTTFANLPDILINYRVGEQNVSVKNSVKQESTKEILLIESLNKILGFELEEYQKEAHITLMFPYRKNERINWKGIITWLKKFDSIKKETIEDLFQIYRDNLVQLAFYNTENGYSTYSGFYNSSQGIFTYAKSIKVKLLLKSLFKVKLKGS